jgi:hypothetical protein
MSAKRAKNALATSLKQTAAVAPTMLDIEEMLIANVEHRKHAKRYHRFATDEIPAIRSVLLAWYDANKRDLPWRKTWTSDMESDTTQLANRAYAGTQLGACVALIRSLR